MSSLFLLPFVGLAHGLRRNFSKLRELQQVKRAQAYAVRRAFGVDRLLMQEWHPSDKAMLQVAEWEPIDDVMRRARW